MFRWFPLLLACAGLVACSKANPNKPPQVFLPRLIGAEGQDLDARRAVLCNPKQIDIHDNILTQQNFQSIFQCANYDNSLDELTPLFNSASFPELLNSVNLVLKSDNTKSIKDTLRGWLEDGPEGTSRADRLLPFVSSLIKNPSFQDFLPVLDGILQAGKDIWRDLLPGIADVVYTELFPDNIEDAFVIVNSFTGGETSAKKKEDKDYAKSVKDFANFLKTDVDGKTASLYALELVNGIRDIQVPGTSLYEFLENMLEKGSISSYFLDSGTVRGEALDPKLNETADDPANACPDLNDTPEQRQQCAYERLFKRPAEGGEAPLTQLAGLVVEFQKDHPDLLPSLAGWFSANGPRVVNGLSQYVIRAQVVTNLSKLNVGNFLVQFAQKSGMDPNAQITSDQFALLIHNAFASPDFVTWLDGILPAFNQDAFGPRNAKFLKAATLDTDISTLYQAPEVEAFAKVIIPSGTAGLTQASRKFNNKHRSDALLVDFQGQKKNIEQHLGNLWWTAASTILGEDVILDYVIKLAQTLITQLANNFKDKGTPIAEWYFTSPYGNPGTTEMLAGYLVKELDMLPKYYRNKEWLKNDFTNEAFSNDDDKRAFRLLVDQIPNVWQYIKSGMSRSGGDLTRALARDQNNYLVKTYVNLIVKATEIGWVSKGVRLIEAYQQRPGRARRAKVAVSDEIPDRRKYKMGVEATERIVRSLIRPEREGDYSTATLSRLVTPLSSIVGEPRRAESERFLLTSADQLLGLTDKQINDFMNDFGKAKPPGTVADRRETFRSLAEMLRKESFPDLVKHLAALFQENAVRPALDFLAKKIDDGSLPRVLLFIRRLLGFGSVG